MFKNVCLYYDKWWYSDEILTGDGSGISKFSCYMEVEGLQNDSKIIIL